MESKNELFDINIFDIIKIIRKSLLLIFLVSIFIAVISSVYTFYFVKPSYISSADVMIQVQTSSSDVGFDYITAQKLVSTLQEFLQKDIVLEQAAKDQNYGLSIEKEDIRRGLVISSSNTSYFINISYESEDKYITGKVVNAVIDSAISIANNNESFSSIRNKIARTSIAKDEGTYHSPNKLMYISIGTFAGLLMSGGIVFFRELMNNTYRTKEELENTLEYNILGIIPEYKIKGGK